MNLKKYVELLTAARIDFIIFTMINKTDKDTEIRIEDYSPKLREIESLLKNTDDKLNPEAFINMIRSFFGLDRISDFTEINILNYLKSVLNADIVNISSESYALILHAVNTELSRSLNDLYKENVHIGLPVMIFRCKNDEDFTISYISDSCKTLTGYDASELNSYKHLISNEYTAYVKNKWDDAVKNKSYAKIEYEITTSNLEKKWVYELGQPVYKENGEVDFLEGIVIDINERKYKEIMIQNQNNFDSMTGVYNRNYFNFISNEICSSCNYPLSLIFADINGLKLINDAFGHESGDELILNTTKILKEAVRSSDYIFRLGGDEFVILLQKASSELANSVMNRIKSGCKGYHISDLITEDISIALGSYTMDKAEKLEIALKKAEDAMYKDKLNQNKKLRNRLIDKIKAVLTSDGTSLSIDSKSLYKIIDSISKELNLDPSNRNKLMDLLPIYNIGHIAIPKKVLKKAGPLTKEEWELIKKHPEIGYRIAMSTVELQAIADSILCHHERWDGNGYPEKLSGEQIPLLARIISVVSAFDAMTSERSYKAPLDKIGALEEIKKNSGTQFDPQVVEIFSRIMEREFH